MNVLAFDIETVPDIEAGRALYSLDELGPVDVARVMLNKCREQTGEEILPTHLQRVAAISAVYRSASQNECRVWSFGAKDSTEKEILTRFFEGIDELKPTLVTWNGGGFELPVLNHRGLINAVTARCYWEAAEGRHDYERTNRSGRSRSSHIDLMQILAGDEMPGRAPLNDMATLLGFPGEMAARGVTVWDQFLAGDFEGICNDCEINALNTYLVYLQWLGVKGSLSGDELAREFETVKSVLDGGSPYQKKFLAAWEK